MEQNSTEQQNKYSEFAQKNKNYIIAGIIVILALVYFSAQGNGKKEAGEEQRQTSSQNTETMEGEKNPNEASSSMDQQNQTSKETVVAHTGNVTANGTLAHSNNSAKGNLMVESDSGTIYISTKKNYTALIGKQVTIHAEGTLTSFTFLGLNEQLPQTTAAATDKAHSSTVHVKGVLKDSDNTAKGNYVIVSGQQKIYLASTRNYSAWLGQEVSLNATGTIQNFTNALVSK